MALRDFSHALDGSDVAVLYFSGHGLHESNDNWLVPVDAQLTRPTDVFSEAVRLSDIVTMMGKARLRIILLDACRNNPFAMHWPGTKSGDAGLLQFSNPTEGTVIAYSAGPNQKAPDDGFFARTLAHRLSEDGVELKQLLFRLGNDVRAHDATLAPEYTVALENSSPFYFRESTAPTLAVRARGPVNSAPSKILARWVQYDTSGDSEARVITDGDDCPEISFDASSHKMFERRGPDREFPVRLCTGAIADNIATANVQREPIPIPTMTPHRILVLGPSGCLIKGAVVQSCNNTAAWPFPEIARRAALLRPDLIIYVGDYISRESACPPSEPGCAGSPSGDNWPTWLIDFLGPMQPLLDVAPAIFVRSNHNECARVQSWTFLFGSSRFEPAHACSRDLPPFAVKFPNLKLVVADTSASSDIVVDETLKKKYQDYFDSIPDLVASANISHNPVWLLSNRPLAGVLTLDLGLTVGGNRTMLATLGPSALTPVTLMISGEIHAFEALNYEESYPPQLIARPSGGLLDNAPSNLKGMAVGLKGTAEQIKVLDGVTLHGYGFVLVLDDDAGWHANVYNQNGEIEQTCSLIDRTINCKHT